MARAAAAPGLLALAAGGCAFVGLPSANPRLRASAVAVGQGALLAGEPQPAASSSLLAACSAGGLVAAAAAAVARRGAKSARRAAKKKEELVIENIPRPEDLLESPKFPLFMGATGGYMSKATRERHAITWTSKEEFEFELPTGGVGIMNKGENLCYFRKKEQCIMVGKQLRKMKIDNYKVYRLAKDGTVTFLHPADGVFPEKVNKGRVQVNGRPFTVLQNPHPANLKWTKYHMKTYEADPLTTMFVKARLMAWADQENLFPLPQPDRHIEDDEEMAEYTRKLKETLGSL